MKHLEQAAQIQVVWWLRRYRPEVVFTSAGAVGDRLNFRLACRVKAMGYLAGYPDLAIHAPRGEFHGLFVEMKRADGGTLSKVQKDVIKRLEANGYKVLVCHGAQAAIDGITAYLGDK